MLDKLRIRAFARFIQLYGEERLICCLEENKKSGVIYHYPGQLIGDYDVPETEEKIIQMILTGRRENSRKA